MGTETPTRTAKEPNVRLMTVTPRMAEEWLSRNHGRNRKMRLNKVKEYAADMKAGRWVLSDQAISFDAADQLINGQHRLFAVTESKTDIRSIVLFNAPNRSLLVIDGGMKRNTDDRFGMAGMSYPRGCGATVRRVIMGLTSYAGESISDQRVDEFMTDHGPAVAFAHAALGKGRYALAPVRAVLTRAKIRKTPGERLERFCEVLGSGIMSAGENGAVLLRNYITNLKADAAGSGTARQKLYAVTEAALAAFLAGERVTKLTPAKAELFPITGDRVAA
jgi:hypothetical protein